MSGLRIEESLSLILNGKSAADQFEITYKVVQLMVGLGRSFARSRETLSPEVTCQFIADAIVANTLAIEAATAWDGNARRAVQVDLTPWFPRTDLPGIE